MGMEWCSGPYGKRGIVPAKQSEWVLTAENWFFRHPGWTKDLEGSGIGVTHERADLLTKSFFRTLKNMKLSR